MANATISPFSGSFYSPLTPQVSPAGLTRGSIFFARSLCEKDGLPGRPGNDNPGKWKFDKEHRFLFIDKVVGGSIPREFIAPVEAGIREALDNGILAGFPTVDIAVVLTDGSYHDVDSNEMAFKIAGSMAYKEACAKAKPVLLEPIMKVEVVVPEEYMAAVFGDLNARRSAIQGTENRAGSNVIRVEVPLAQMFGYATDLRSRTQGRATFTMHFSHYAEAPSSVSEEVIAKAKGKAVSK